MRHKRKYRTFSLPMVLSVSLLCAASLVLFFVGRARAEHIEALPPVAVESEPYDDSEYYNQVADEYMASLPDDKVVVARLIDDTHHYLYYYEKGGGPSCYLFDLESLTTEVLFGGERGFYCDTKLLIIGEIVDWRRQGNLLIFIAENQAPGSDYATASVAFSMDVYSRSLQFIDSGSKAYFSDDSHLTVIKSFLLYHNFFSAEDVYTQSPVTYIIG